MADCCDNNSSSLPIGLTGAVGPIGPAGPSGAGDLGPAGAQGPSGTTVLYNNISDVSTTNAAAGAFESLQTYTIAVNELATNGDTIELISTLSVDIETGLAGIRLYINGASVVTVPPASFVMMRGTKITYFRALVSRQSNTTVFIQFDVRFSGGTNFTNTGSSNLFSTGVAVNALSTLTNTIAIFGAENPPGGINTLTAHNLLILKYKI